MIKKNDDKVIKEILKTMLLILNFLIDEIILHIDSNLIFN